MGSSLTVPEQRAQNARTWARASTHTPTTVCEVHRATTSHMSPSVAPPVVIARGRRATRRGVELKTQFALALGRAGERHDALAAPLEVDGDDAYRSWACPKPVAASGRRGGPRAASDALDDETSRAAVLDKCTRNQATGPY